MQATEHPILQLERGALDRWGKGDTAGYSDVYAEDVTYFDPLTRARIDGLRAMLEYYEPWQGKVNVSRYEIVNPQVVDSGELALLTYNLVNYERDADDKEVLGSSWNCTEVYRKVGNAWSVIHSHWSYTAHEAFREPPLEGEATA
jgi:ketosteroid isomerase-like protein